MAVTYTAQQVLQIAKERITIDTIRGLQLLNEAHLYITTQLKLVPDTSQLITTIAGQQEYALPDSVAAIWDASYWSGGFTSGGTNYRPLRATNVDSLFEDSGPNWQLRPSSQPWGYYERGGMIGFVPAPITSGDQVQLFYTPATTLTLQSTLPTNIPSCYAWVYHMCRRQADLDKDPVAEGKWQAKFKAEMDDLRRYIYGRVGRDKVRASYRVNRVKRA